MDYVNIRLRSRFKNKAKQSQSKPIQSQFKAKQSQSKPIQSQFKANQSQFQAKYAENKPNQTQFLKILDNLSIIISTPLLTGFDDFLLFEDLAGEVIGEGKLDC